MAFEFQQKVLFRHCDPAGIVFFPRYFEMINDCVEAFFDTCLGAPFEELHEYGGVPTARISARFIAPSRHGDLLGIRLDVGDPGPSSLGLSIRADCGGQARFSAEQNVVFVNSAGRPVRWPDDIRMKLEQHRGQE